MSSVAITKSGRGPLRISRPIFAAGTGQCHQSQFTWWLCPFLHRAINGWQCHWELVPGQWMLLGWHSRLLVVIAGWIFQPNSLWRPMGLNMEKLPSCVLPWKSKDQHTALTNKCLLHSQTCKHYIKTLSPILHLTLETSEFLAGSKDGPWYKVPICHLTCTR